MILHRATPLVSLAALVLAAPGASARAADADAIYRRGAELERAGKSDLALERYRRAVNRDPQHLKAHRAYQRLMQAAGRREELIAKYDRLLQRSPSKPLYKYLRGRLEPTVEKRRRELEVVTSLDPKFFWAYYELAGLYLEQGRLDQAMIRAERARDILLAAGSDDAEVRNTLGGMYLQAGKLEAAAAEFEKAVEADPALAEAYYNLGLIRASRGNSSEALAYLRKAIELRPAFAEAHCSLGHVHGRAGRLDEAVRCYKKAILAKPDYGLAHNNLAVAYHRLGKKWLAMASLQNAKSLGFAVTPAFERAVVRALGDEWKPPEPSGKPGGDGG